jgi:hypothetical protein
LSNCIIHYFAARCVAILHVWCNFAAIIIFGACLSTPILAADRIVDLNAYTEEWPPYNFMLGTEIKGISTDLLLAAYQLAQLRCNLHMVPWARAKNRIGNA